MKIIEYAFINNDKEVEILIVRPERLKSSFYYATPGGFRLKRLAKVIEKIKREFPDKVHFDKKGTAYIVLIS